jgi:hypothetical protein
MASYRAIQTGDWSDINTWQIWNGSAWVAATDIPDDDDDVWANSYTVTIDQDVTVLTIRNSTSGAPGSGTVAGGGFIVTISGISFTCINDLRGVFLANANTLLTIETINGITNINLNLVHDVTSLTSLTNMVIFSGNSSIINFTGNISIGRSNVSSFDVIGSDNVVNMISFFEMRDAGNNVVFSRIGGTNNVVNITGGLTTITNIPSSNQVLLALTSSTATLNIIGNVENNILNGTNNNVISISTGGGTVFVNGLIRGSSVLNNQTAIRSIVSCFVEVNGQVIAGNSSGSGSGCPAIVTTSQNSIVILSGPFIFGNYGTMPFDCARVFLSNNTSNYIEFADDSTNGALFPNAAPTRETMYSPNTLADSPTESDVREGVTYALGSQTGTLAVPDPASVALNVPTDNTVGTAILTPEALFDAIENETHPMATRLKNVSTVQSTGDQLTSL